MQWYQATMRVVVGSQVDKKELVLAGEVGPGKTR